jgi:putative spermidine/putrescine transport system permease protein
MDRQSAVPLVFKIIAALALVILLLPVVVVVLAGLNAGEFLTFPPQGLSLRWVEAFLTSPTFLPAYLYSLCIAAVTTVFSTMFGTMAALYVTRSQTLLASVLRGFFMLPIVLPGVVVGLALFIFYSFIGGGLVGSYAGLLIAHVLVTSPFVIATVSASLVGFDRSLEEAARSLGATALVAFRKVTLPIIAPGITAGALFAFIISFGQFEVALFLSVPGHEPLPSALFVSLRYAFEPTSAAAGIFAIVLVVLTTVISSRLVNLRSVFRV